MFRYVLAIAILSTVYTGVQALRQVHELSTGKQQILSQRSLAFVNFFGDQVCLFFHGFDLGFIQYEFRFDMSQFEYEYLVLRIILP